MPYRHNALHPVPPSLNPTLPRTSKSNNRKTARSLTRQVQRPTLSSALGCALATALGCALATAFGDVCGRYPWGSALTTSLEGCVNGILGVCVDAILGVRALTTSLGQYIPALVVESQAAWRAAIGLCVTGFRGLRDLGTYTALHVLSLRPCT